MSGRPPHHELDVEDGKKFKTAEPESVEANPRVAGKAGRSHKSRRTRAQPTRYQRLTGVASSVLQWATLTLVLALPVYLAWDYGGILPWSQWFATCVVLAAGVLAVPLVITRSGAGGRSSLVIPLIALAIWALASLQTVPLGAQAVGWISPGSATAYLNWIPGGFGSQTEGLPAGAASILAGHFPASVAAHLTRAALSGPALFATVCLLAAVLFRSRTTLITMLAAVAISGAAIAFLGISDQIRAPAPQGNGSVITPEVAAAAPFGSFVCRNNAAAYLNLTLAASVGLLVFCFRVAHDRAHGDGAYTLEPESWWDRPVFFLQNLLLQIDTATIAALILVILNIAGILTSQSRGGTLAILSGTLIATLLTGSQGKRWWRPLAILVSVSGVMMLLGSIGLISRVGERLESLWSGGATRDGRLDHWPDGLITAWQYFPGGAGLGTYRFAYLPYQQTSAGAWFVNADNMAVEWLVEGGVWLLPLVLVGVGCFAVQLTRLARIRNAPHLTALVACGWFVIGSQLVSQFFDFGILLPSNYLTLAILVGGVLGALSRKYGKRKKSAYSAPPSGERRIGFALPVTFALALLAVLSAYRTTYQNAGDDHVVRAVSRAGTPLQLDESISEQALRTSTNPMLHTALAAHRIAWQTERGERSLKRIDPEDTVDHSGLATLDARRAAYYLQAMPLGQPAESVLLPDQSMEAIRTARQHALTALILCPLSDAARFHLLQTDFASAGVQVTEQLLQQWGVLRCRSARSLDRASRLAAVYPGAEAAAPLIRQTLALAPERLLRLWPIIELLGEPAEITNFLPDDPVLLLRVIEKFSVDPLLRDLLVVRLRRLLTKGSATRDTAASVDEAQRHYLTGRLELFEQNHEQAAAAFAQAVAADPSTTEYRYQWAESLARTGQHDQAVAQIKLCLLQQPENVRYRAVRDAWTTQSPADRNSGRDRDRRGKQADRPGRGD